MVMAKRRPGRPVTHPPVQNLEKGLIFKTYTDAAKDVGGDRHGVRRVAEGTQSHHHGYHFKYTKEE